MQQGRMFVNDLRMFKRLISEATVVLAAGIKIISAVVYYVCRNAFFALMHLHNLPSLLEFLHLLSLAELFLFVNLFILG